MIAGFLRSLFLLIEITFSKKLLILIFFSWTVFYYKPHFLNRNVIDFEKIDCDFCQYVFNVDKVSNISQNKFQDMYAYTGKPVVIQNSIKHWKAFTDFNFTFFQQLFTRFQNDEDQFDCQFFPYKTNFKTVFEAFHTSLNESNFQDKSQFWYIGWANCYRDIQQVLHEYYERPYFLPLHSEDMKLTWIFMGAPGLGADLHVDNVVYSSWQAQIKGNKKWYLKPPLECFFQCLDLEVIVNEGDIIVIDTNRWYHKTVVLNSNFSITLGSEFD